jgi:hypothetical protein
MGSTGALLAIVILICFLGGITIGIIGIVSVASRREDAYYSLDSQAPNALLRGVRRLMGIWVRGPVVRPLGWPEPRQDSPATENPATQDTASDSIGTDDPDEKDDTWTWRRETLR